MKKNKWTKWKISALGAIGLVILFHEVKGSDAFKAAQEQIASASGEPPAANADSSKTYALDGDGFSSPSQFGRRGGGQSGRGSGGGSSMQQRGGGSFGPTDNGSSSGSNSNSTRPQTRTQTRTGRS